MVTDSRLIQKNRLRRIIGDSQTNFPVPDPTAQPGWSYILTGAILLIGCFLAMPFDQVITQWLQLDHLPGDVAKAISLAEFFAHGFGVITIIMGVAILVPNYRSSVVRLAACTLCRDCWLK